MLCFLFFLVAIMPHLAAQGIIETKTGEEGERTDRPEFLPQPALLSAADSLFSAPDTAFIGQTLVGNCDTLRLPITNLSSDTVVIDSLLLSSPSPTLQLPAPVIDSLLIVPGGTVEIILVFCPIDTGCLSAQVELLWRLITEEKVDYHNIGITACGGRPLITVTPPVLDYGPVRVDDCRIDSFVIGNNGNYPLLVRTIGIATAGSPYRILSPSQLPLTIRPGRSQSVVVEFCPDREETVADTLHITSNASEPVVARILRGEGAVVRFSLPDTFDFGTVTLGRCLDTFLTARNTSSLSATFTGIELKGSLPEKGFDLIGSYDPGWRRELPPGDTFRIPIRFCPVDTGEVVNAEPVMLSEESGGIGMTVLRGSGRIPAIRFGLTEIDFGSVIPGRCRDTVITLYNFDTTFVILSEIVPDRLSGIKAFEIAPLSAQPWRLEPGDSLLINVRFCPEGRGEAEDRITVRSDAGTSTGSDVRGNGLIPIIWLDSAHANAGEEALLTLRIWPTDILNRRAYTIDLRVSPAALFTRKVVTDGSASYSQGREGKIRINGTYPAKISPDGRILQISFLGLSTGSDVNPVEIEEFDPADSVAMWDTIRGIVYLSGCEVGRIPGVGKRAALRSVQPNPASSNVTLIWQAPEGRIAYLSIYDGLGGKVMTIPLPEGDGTPKEFQLDLNDLPRGLYMLELVEREERGFYPLLID